MPYLNIKISSPKSLELEIEIEKILTKYTAEILGKKPEVTSICIEYIEQAQWFVGGSRISEQGNTTFYLDVKITSGTNTKNEKQSYIKNIYAELSKLLGSTHPASYIVIHDVLADSWGFEGLTQENRFINSQNL